MNLQEFMETVLEKMKDKVKDAESVEIKAVRKNNDVLLHGLTIRMKQSNVTPTIYMESFYELYHKGMALERIVEKIWKMYQESMPKSNISMEFFKDFDQVKDRIVYRLVNSEKNQELLKNVPHIPFWDLTLCFYYAFWSEELGDGMILIHNSHMENWKADCRKLMQLAEHNTRKLFPLQFLSMREMLKQVQMNVDLNEEEEMLFILTNQEKIHGATVMLYPNALNDVAERLQSDFYILPSSIHEVLILKADREKFNWESQEDTGKFLHEMISDINRNQLSAEEVLSDFPFFYHWKEKRIIQIK